MIPETHDVDTGRLTYVNGWSSLEYLLATTFKASTDLSGYVGPWPQLLNLDVEMDFEHNERIQRPPPAEPLVLVKEHELGDCIFRDDEEVRRGHVHTSAASSASLCASAHPVRPSACG
jgi:hypothetical protein